MSNGMDTVPPAVGGVVCTLYSVLFAGAEAMFAPLEPSRFSAPQLTPESPSPVAALAVELYVYVMSSLSAPVPAAPPAVWSQTSNVWVVLFPKFFTFSQSTMIQSLDPSVSTLTRTLPGVPPVVGAWVGSRSLQSGASTLFGFAAFGKCCGVNTRSVLSPPPTTM